MNIVKHLHNPFSGLFTIRLTPEQHRQLVQAAEHAEEALGCSILVRNGVSTSLDVRYSGHRAESR